MDMSLGRLQAIGDGQGSLVCCSQWGRKESDMTERLNWTDSEQESLRRNGIALIVNRRVWNAVLVCNLKNDRMISVCFQGKPFNITVIQVYAPTRNAEETKTEWF